MDKRIDQLSSVTPVISDLMAIYDSSNPGTKKITLAQLAALIGSAGASVQKLYITNATGTSVTDATLIGKTLLLILRGGIGTGEIIESGTPIGEQILFNASTGEITPSTDLPFVDETLTIQYT
jgi:hypothetical protein